MTNTRFADVQDIGHNTDYHSFKRRWGEDPRFQALDRKERENLLNERYGYNCVYIIESMVLVVPISVHFCFWQY